MLFGMLYITAFAQPPKSYNQGPSAYGEGEPGKCYAQCLKTEADTIYYECETKPKWVVPSVSSGYPNVTTTTYQIKEPCSECKYDIVKEKNSTKAVVKVRNAYCEYVTTDCSFVTVRDSYLIQEGHWKYNIDKPRKLPYSDTTIMLTGVTEKGLCKPAQKGARYQDVMIQEECVEIEVSEYIWTTTTNWQQVAPARTKWVRRPGDENCLSANPEDCMVWCEIEVPAERAKCEIQEKKGCPYGYTDNGEYCIKKTTVPPKYKKVKVETCEEPASFDKSNQQVSTSETVKVDRWESGSYTRSWIPPRYKYYNKRVIKEEPSIDSTCYPALYDTIELELTVDKVNGLITQTPGADESCDLTKCVEPDVKTDPKGPITNRDFVVVYNTKPGDWVEVLCPADVTSYTIREIQRALSAKGYNPGPIDNVLGAQTKSALQQFQKDYGLPVGQLDLQTLAALGISF